MNKRQPLPEAACRYATWQLRAPIQTFGSIYHTHKNGPLHKQGEAAVEYRLPSFRGRARLLCNLGKTMMRLSMLVGLLLAASTAVMQATAAPMTLQGAMAYPFISSLVASPDGKAVAWVREVAGVRNICAKAGCSFANMVRMTAIGR